MLFSLVFCVAQVEINYHTTPPTTDLMHRPSCALIAQNFAKKVDLFIPSLCAVLTRPEPLSVLQVI